MLDTLPEKIRRALITYTEDIDYPIEAVVEIAIASFLDPNSLSFVDCQPMTAIQRKAG